MSLVVFILASKIGGFISKKLGQPAVLGEIMAGIIIGPYVLGFYQIEPVNEFIKGISELGVILLLFLVGLHLDTNKIKNNFREGVWVAVLGVIIPFIVGLALATYLISSPSGLLSAHNQFPQISEGLIKMFFAALLTATSISLTAKILMEYRKLDSKPGIVVLNAAVLDDVIAVLLFTTILTLVTSGSVHINSFFVIGISIAIFFIFVLFFEEQIISNLVSFGKYLDLRVEEGLFSIILAFIFLFSFIAHYLNLSAVIGAFLIGVICSEKVLGYDVVESFYKISYGFFIPIFFTSIGAQIDPTIVLEKTNYVLLIFFFAFFSKLIGSSIGAYISKLSFLDSILVGLGMVPRMEVAITMASLGVQHNILLSSDFSVIVSSLLLTLIITPFLMKGLISYQKGELHNIFRIKRENTALWIGTDPLMLSPGELGVLKLHIKNMGAQKAKNVEIRIYSESIDFEKPHPDVPLKTAVKEICRGGESTVEFAVQAKSDAPHGSHKLLIDVDGENVTHDTLDVSVFFSEPEIDIHIDESKIAIGKLETWPTGKVRIELANTSEVPLYDLTVHIKPDNDYFNGTEAIIGEIGANERRLLELDLVAKIKDIAKTKYSFEVVVKKAKKKISSRFFEAPVRNEPLIDYDEIRPSEPALFHDNAIELGEENVVVFRLKNWGWVDASNISIWLEGPPFVEMTSEKINLEEIKMQQRTQPLILSYRAHIVENQPDALIHICWCCTELKKQINRNAFTVRLDHKDVKEIKQ